MEAARPDVDAHVLNLLRTRVFRASDFNETRNGVCRIQSPLTEQLSKTLLAWRRTLAPAAEFIATSLSRSTSAKARPMPTPLTRANHAASRAVVRKRVAREQAPGPTCKRCGGDVPNRRRVYCDTCLPSFQQEQLEPRPPHTGPRRGPKSSVDQSHGGDAAERRGTTNRQRKAAVRAWDEQYGKLVDLSAFDRDILPRIQVVSLSRLCRATGLSLRYISQVRRGEKRPHPRHWAALLAALEE